VLAFRLSLAKVPRMQGDDQADDGQDYTAHVSVKVHRPATAQEREDRQDRRERAERERRTELRQRRALFLEALTLVAVVGALYVYRGQWAALRHQGDVLKQQVLAMRAQVRLMLDQQRPWLLPFQASGNLVLNPGEAFSTPVEWKNSGQTPALDVQLSCATKTLLLNEEFSADYGTEEPSSKGSRSVIGPSQTVPSLCWSSGLTPSEVDEIKAGTRLFYVYGKSQYRDTARRTHHSTFCLWLNPGAEGDPQATPVTCATNNDAD
jgi:hypothetical protein